MVITADNTKGRFETLLQGSQLQAVANHSYHACARTTTTDHQVVPALPVSAASLLARVLDDAAFGEMRNCGT
ncbi:TPA: hypothetical protein ACH3X1_006096 [Trebouxia sp. C0004]